MPIIDFVKSLTSLDEIQMIATRIISHAERILQSQAHQIHVIVFGLGSLTATHSARTAQLQLALLESVVSHIKDCGGYVIKYAVDPLFTEQDRAILFTLGYSIPRAQDSCTLSSFLHLQESDRVVCYLPHLPLHLVLSALLSAPSNSVFLCPSINKVLELEFLADPNSQLHHLSIKLKRLWKESNEYDWLKYNVITIQPIIESKLLKGANLAYSCTSVYIRP